MEFATVVQLFEDLDKTTKRGQKTRLVSQLLAKTPPNELEYISLLLQGRVFPTSDSRNLGISTNYVIKALARATGYSKEDITTMWSKIGDLGTVATQICQKKKQSTLFAREITIEKIFSNLQKLPAITGNGAIELKTQLICDLLTSATALEAKYIVRIVLEVLRVGVGEGILRDAIVTTYFPAISHLCVYDEKNQTFTSLLAADSKDYTPITVQTLPKSLTNKYLEINDIANLRSITSLKDIRIIITDSQEIAMEVQKYFSELVQSGIDMTNDIGLIAEIASKQDLVKLKNISPAVGKPLRVMLAKKAADVDEAFESVGSPCMVEYKYDGFRIQIHKNGKEVLLYTRRLEEVTNQFPDVVEYIKESVNADNCILDSEAVGYDPKKGTYLPFQHISQRIRRKYDISQLQSQVPVEVNIFDIIVLNGKNMLDQPFEQRRKLIEKIIDQKKKKIVVSKAITTDSKEKALEFYQESLKAGNEGVMLKSLNAPYKPGSRVGYMMKLKPVMDTLDLVITQATWGDGKRAQWLTSFTIACVNEDGEFKDIGKVGTGFKELKEEESDLTFDEMTKMLEPLKISEAGREIFVKPEIVLEIAFEEIQKSQTYSSGYALRFPRVIGIRNTRSAQSASDQGLVEEFYYAQQKVKK